MYTIIFQP